MDALHLCGTDFDEEEAWCESDFDRFEVELDGCTFSLDCEIGLKLKRRSYITFTM